MTVVLIIKVKFGHRHRGKMAMGRRGRDWSYVPHAKTGIGQPEGGEVRKGSHVEVLEGSWPWQQPDSDF